MALLSADRESTLVLSLLTTSELTIIPKANYLAVFQGEDASIGDFAIFKLTFELNSLRLPGENAIFTMPEVFGPGAFVGSSISVPLEASSMS